MDLQGQILQTLSKVRNIDQRRLALVSRVNESSISRYLNGHEEINFEGVLRIVKFLYPDQEIEIMRAYIPTQKSRNARYALEYCVMNQLWDLVEGLLELLSASTNPLDKEWATMYELLLVRNQKVISPKEQLDKAEVFKPKELEMCILKSIFKAYIYHELEETQALRLHVEGTEDLIEQIKSSFIQDSFKVRLSLILSIISLYDNQLEESRRYSQFVLDQVFFDHVKGTAYNNLGLSYMFESYEQSSDYLNKALDSFANINNARKVNMSQKNLAFLKIHWNKLDDYSKNDLNNVYFLIKKGKTESAKEELSRVSVESLNEWDKAFFYLYRGILEGDKQYLYLSVESFLYLNDYFHIELAIEELKKLGENEVVLRIFKTKRRK